MATERAKHLAACTRMDFAPGPFSGETQEFSQVQPTRLDHSPSAFSTSGCPDSRQCIWDFWGELPLLCALLGQSGLNITLLCNPLALLLQPCL